MKQFLLSILPKDMPTLTHLKNRCIGLSSRVESWKLSSSLEHFAFDRSGNIAVTTAIVLPLAALPLVGAAVDYSRATNTKTQLQDHLDAASWAAYAELDKDVLENGTSYQLEQEQKKLKKFAAKHFKSLVQGDLRPVSSSIFG